MFCRFSPLPPRNLSSLLGSDPMATSSYADRIPDAQRHLHQNINSPKLTNRVSAWKNDLSYGEQWLFERIAGKTLQARGYTLVTSFLPLRFSEGVDVLRQVVKYVPREIVRVFAVEVARIRRIGRDPKRILAKVRMSRDKRAFSQVSDC